LRQVENPDYKGMSLGKSFVKFYQTQGVQGLFKGNSASIARIFPFSAIEFYSMEFYKNKFIHGRPERSGNILYTMLCGSLAGLNAITFTFPLDVARTRLAATTQNSAVKENSLVGAIVNLWKNEGVRGLYKGYSLAAGVSIYIMYRGQFRSLL
jgi:solute carrier family 25 protein 16